MNDNFEPKRTGYGAYGKRLFLIIVCTALTAASAPTSLLVEPGPYRWTALAVTLVSTGFAAWLLIDITKRRKRLRVDGDRSNPVGFPGHH